MTVAQQIRTKINSIPSGLVFTYGMIGVDAKKKQTATKTIQRLIEKKKIVRVSKGKFYRPEKSIFGDVRPSANELLKTYLYKDNKLVAYETGNSLYNRLGLTTQVSKYINLAVYKSRITLNKNNLNIKSVKAYALPTEKNIKYLQYLDIIRDFKTIPDIDINYTIQYLSKQLQELDSGQLIKYALKYPPRVMALLGAIMEMNNIGTGGIKQKLNSLSSYKYGISYNTLPSAKNWHIK